jgi:hypothetical protein
MKMPLRIYALLLGCSTLLAPAAWAGQVPWDSSRIERSTEINLVGKRYVAAGDRAYVVGVQDGSAPVIGWHITGKMGGVWTQPVKLLHHYQFSLNGQTLPAATKFVSGTGYVRLEIPQTAGVNITRTEFAPDGLPVLLVGIKLSNPDSQTKSVTLAIQAQSEMIAPYPWQTTIPSSDELHQQDQVSFDSTLSALEFTQPGKPWTGLVAAAQEASDRRNGFESLGASSLGPVTDKSTKDATGTLSYQVTLNGRSDSTIWFAVAGSNVDKSEAAWALKLGLLFPEFLLNQKIAQRHDLLEQSDINLPDSTIQAAFEWGKLNLADMHRKVRNMNVRDTMEGTVYPSAPVVEIPFVSGFGAGYPDYPWFFGTDGAYTTFPLVAVGQWEQAKEHLRTIRQISRAVNDSTGKVLHEIVTDGSIYFGTNAQTGDTNETPEFATAVATVWRWSGDDSFRDENYDFIKTGMNYVLTSLNLNNDGWPEGAGMVESQGMGAKKLDVAVYTIRALNDLAEMAASKGDTTTHDWAAKQSATLQSKFDNDWWMEAQGLFADSLALNYPVKTDPTATLGTAPITKLEQLYWTNATPMETGLALSTHASVAFPTLESTAGSIVFTGANGFYQQASGPGIKGNLQASVVNTGVMAVAESNYGRMDESLKYIGLVASGLDVEQPGALPELLQSPNYEYFQAFTGRAMVMQAWSSYGIHWPIITGFLGVNPHASNRELSVVPRLPSSWPQLSVDDLHVGSAKIAVFAQQSGKLYVTRVDAPAGWQLTIGHTLPSTSQVKSVTLNGQSAAFQIVNTNRGQEVRVQTSSGRNQILQVEIE